MRTALLLAFLPLVVPAFAQEAVRPRLVLQEGHTSEVHDVQYSPDGRYIATAGGDNSVRLWDAATGAELLAFEETRGTAYAVAFSPDGQRVAAGDDFEARVWDIATGEIHLTLRQDDPMIAPRITDVAFSPDGRRLLTFGSDGIAIVWDAESGEELVRFEGHTDDEGYIVEGTAVFSPDTTRALALTASGDNARLWDSTTGDEVLVLWGGPAPNGGSGTVNAANFSPDGTQIVTGELYGTTRVWDATTGDELRRFDDAGPAVLSASFSPDGDGILTVDWAGRARLRDAETGEVLVSLRGHIRSDRSRLLELTEDDRAPILSAAFSPDGTRLVTGGEDWSARVWHVATGEALARLEGRRQMFAFAAFSPGGTRVVTAGEGVRIWNVTAGAEPTLLNERPGLVTSAAITEDGSRVVTAEFDSTARVWDAGSGEEVLRLEGHRGVVASVAFDPSETRVVTTGTDGTARIWDVTTGEELLLLRYEQQGIPRAWFSPDGGSIVTAAEWGANQIWDAATGDSLGLVAGVWDGPTGVIPPSALTPDSSQVLFTDGDGSTWAIDVATETPLAQLVSFTDGTWAVLDPEGRYDASNGGDVDGLAWVLDTPDGMEPIRLAQLKARYYDPGLLAKHLGLSDEPLRDVAAFRERGVPLYPRVEIVEAGPAGATVRLGNRGGGIGRVQMLLNGSEVVADARPTDFDSASDSLAVTLDLTPFARFLLPDTTNALEVVAENAEGSLRSRRVRSEFRGPRAARGLDVAVGGTADADYAPHLWAVVVGTGDYVGNGLDLRFAGKDAVDVAAGLEVAAGRLFGPERTHLALLTTEADADGRSDGRPSREAILAALDSVAARADARDVILVYLAGHGVVHGGQDGDFYYLTAEAASGDLADAAVREAVAVSSAELEDRLASVPTARRVLILDTCASGRVVEQLSAPRDVPGAQLRSLDRLKDNTGTFVLAGSAADAVSYEASTYGQGLLTWSLLEGMRLAADADDNALDVLAWFDHAQRRVPELARSVGGVQRPELVMPRGKGSYPVGRVRPEDQARIPLQDPRPVVLRTSFRDDLTWGDPIELTRAVNEALREVSASGARGQGAPLVYVDAEGYPEAYRLAGSYTTEGERVSVEARLIRRGVPVAAMTVSGASSDVVALAAEVVARATAAMETAE